MKIKGTLKIKLNARHQRHLLTKFDNNFSTNLLDALDTLCIPFKAVIILN